MQTMLKEKNAVNVTPLQLEKAVNSHAAALVKKIDKALPVKAVLENILFTKDGAAVYTDGIQLIKIDDFTEPAENNILINAMTGAVYDGPGTYPDYERLIPNTNGPAAAAFDPAKLLAITEPLKKDVAVVKLSFLDDLIKINNIHTAETFIQAELKTETNLYNEAFTFAVDLKRLLNTLKFLKRLKIQEIQLYFISPVRPLVFKAGKLTFLLMPVRTN